MGHNDNIKFEEYKYLKQEHENNRKFIFERPLLIITGMLTAFLGIKEGPTDIFGYLPLLFLAILWFNMWFTYNRMQSSARIVTYIQRFHEATDKAHWIGWEHTLQIFRLWILKNKKKKHNPSKLKKIISDSNSMGFYSHIFYFHLFFGYVFIVLSLIKSGIIINNMTSWSIYNLNDSNKTILIINTIVAFIFSITLIPYRPTVIRRAIVNTRNIWDNIIDNWEENLKSIDIDPTQLKQANLEIDPKTKNNN